VWLAASEGDVALGGRDNGFRWVAGGADGVWAVTCYFNPGRNGVRKSNYHLFREHLGVPLVTVELAYDDAFDLVESDAEILIQIRGGAVLFQKERLLNVAIRALPESCDKVVWIDSDIIFGAEDWPRRVSEALDHFPIVQPFEKLHHMPRSWQAETFSEADASFTWQSAVHAISEGELPGWAVNPPAPPATDSYALGSVWAAQRGLLDRHGLYDAGIVGGGPRLVACAAYGILEPVIVGQRMNSHQRRRYLDWAVPFARDIGGAVAPVAGDVFHLWHGDLTRRGYDTRHRDLAPYGFDPYEDIAVAENGAWRWSSEKPEMHRFLERFFAAREVGT
jgi:hypothetical protein